MTRLLALLACLLCGPAAADRQSFPPVDQANRDPVLVEFRNDLLGKVRARDIDAVVALACPDIDTSHDTDTGPASFRASLDVQNQGDQTDKGRKTGWNALETTLSQPGYFDDQGEFWMPHQWQITLPASLNPAIAYYVTGENVSLRQTPSRDGTVLGLISHEIVLVPNYQEASEYQLVRLTDGGQGYMHSDFLWSMIGYRAAFVKSDDGAWQLCTFVTGD